MTPTLQEFHLIGKAVQEGNFVEPVWGDFERAFETFGEELTFWYNDAEHSTHMVRELLN